ncbi:MAG: hypothetical protein HOB92_07290, partial [Candidatus Cloacimonetes bacterium]|nr:hypothetical protein [Candidatus Cloacimonadota bacterium]
KLFDDPQLQARNMLVEVDQPNIGKIKVAGNPVKLSTVPAEDELPKDPAPGVGEHTTSILMQAPVEVIRQIIVPLDDSFAIYELLETYLNYIKTIKKNEITIFWRFLLKLSKIIGIEFSTNYCIECEQQKLFHAYFPQKHGFICNDCFHPVNDEQVFKLNIDAADLISKLNSIGNYINDISISKSSIKQINRIFLIHLSEHFHKKIYLKSIELL